MQFQLSWPAKCGCCLSYCVGICVCRSQKIWLRGSAPWDRGRPWPSRNTPLPTCYRAKFGRSRSHCMGEGGGPKKVLGMLWPHPMACVCGWVPPGPILTRPICTWRSNGASVHRDQPEKNRNPLGKVTQGHLKSSRSSEGHLQQRINRVSTIHSNHFLSEMTYNVLMWTLNPTNSLTHPSNKGLYGSNNIIIMFVKDSNHFYLHLIGGSNWC